MKVGRSGGVVALAGEGNVDIRPLDEQLHDTNCLGTDDRG